MKHTLNEVYWGRSYPKRLEDDNLILTRSNWGFKLIYSVYLKQTGEDLGTCHVMEKAGYTPKCKCNETSATCKCENKKYTVVELSAKSDKLIKRLEDIQKLVRERF